MIQTDIVGDDRPACGQCHRELELAQTRPAHSVRLVSQLGQVGAEGHSRLSTEWLPCRVWGLDPQPHHVVNMNVEL